MSLASRNPIISLALAALLVLAACSGKEDTAQPEDPVIELRVMTFNIEWGGDNVDFSKVVEAIKLSRADIVGIQEAEGNLQRLAAELGWHYNLPNYVISRFPLIAPSGVDDRYILIEIQPDRVVALANVHLPSDPSGSERIRDGAGLDEILELERNVRLPKIAPYLGTLKALADAGIASFITGDFNAPAHTDWTDAMVGARPFMPYAVDWPVSKAVHAAGFQDSWRVAHPDPSTHPGLTWWAARPPIPSYTPGENDAQDRIDFVWFSGPADLRSSEIVGEEGGPEVSIAVSPWPSDHRGVVSMFAVRPAEMPPLVSTRRRINRLGDAVEIVAHGVDRTSIRFSQEGGKPVAVGGPLDPGRYRVHAVTPDGVALEKDFWVVDPSTAATVKIEGSEFSVGQAIPIAWRNAPGNRNDYVAAFRTDNDVTYTSVLAWTYINAMPDGKVVLDQSTAEWGWPLAPGHYIIRLMKDDGYDSLAESDEFDVR